jgi:DtxR family Mn-dependent transcriptional regulator
MRKRYSQSTQDYLKSIYYLTENGSSASTNDLSKWLNLAPASITGMLKKLASAEPPLVNYRKHQGVKLTEVGERAALEVIRHHRLLETWLVQTLGYKWDEVHEEACRLEHVISEEFENRIAAALGNPVRDPHGDPIPSPDLLMPRDESKPLSSLRPGQKAIVIRVNASDPELLRYLDDLGFIPQAQLEVSDYSPFDGNLTLDLAGREVVLGISITTNIFVELAG